LRKVIALAQSAAETALLKLNRATVTSRLKDVDRWIQEIIKRVLPFTMTSPERIAALCKSIEYIVANRIPGDIVECGVWKGGSSMAAALALRHFGVSDVTLHLYDTFEGMSEPSEHDLQAQSGRSAVEMLSNAHKDERIWCLAGLAEVRKNLYSTGYPEDLIKVVKGKVEDTIPSTIPDTISILRLDTDWYDSTRHELTHLYPRLAIGGALIIDDYGYWAGARKAVDEYFQGQASVPLLNRIDATGRIAVKLV
jgi:O-methyltransferase